MGGMWEPVKGKCTWWREFPIEDDRFDARLKAPDRRTSCQCFVEGHGWVFSKRELPSDCPHYRHCRYYIKAV